MTTITTIVFNILLILCLALAIFTIVILVVGLYKEDKEHEEYIQNTREQLQAYTNEFLNRK